MNYRNPRLQFSILAFVCLVALAWYNSNKSESNCVANTYVRMRPGPSVNYDDKMWVLADGDVLILTGERENGLLEVRTDTGITGWIEAVDITNENIVCGRFYIQKNIPDVNPYSSCINWKEAKDHYGEKVCVFGKIIFVDREYLEDPLIIERFYYAFFSSNKISDFYLVSPDKPMDAFLGKCVIVRGELEDKDESPKGPTIGFYLPSSSASAIFGNEPTQGFSIYEVPEKLCP